MPCAGEVIEAVTGRRVEDCITDTVLHPLGVRQTGFGYADAAPRSVGYVRMPAPLAPALRWALPSGIVGERVAGHTALRPFLVSGAAYGGLIGTAAAAVTLAAAQLGDPAFVEHYGTGLGYWNAMRIYPDLGLAMVAMANTTSEWDFDGLFTQLSGG